MAHEEDGDTVRLTQPDDLRRTYRHWADRWNKGLEHPVVRAALDERGINTVEARVDPDPQQAENGNMPPNLPTPDDINR
jgi:hypothetical protein